MCCTLVHLSVVLKLCLSGSQIEHAPSRAKQPLAHVALATFGDPDDEHYCYFHRRLLLTDLVHHVL